VYPMDFLLGELYGDFRRYSRKHPDRVVETAYTESNKVLAEAKRERRRTRNLYLVVCGGMSAAR
jgi:hypothetical protein